MRTTALLFLLFLFTMSCSREKLPTRVNLSEQGTSNCYIVTGAGEYSITADIIGNGEKGIIKEGNFHTSTASIAPYSADLVWQDKPGLITEIELSADKRQLYFKASAAKGNAVVSVKDISGKILWSWHLWCTDKPEDQIYIGLNANIVVMDRNLGATGFKKEDGVTTHGLFYQWGRKDPLRSGVNTVETSEETGTIEYTIANPSTFVTATYPPFDWYFSIAQNNYLWGNPASGSQLTKTIYDPCPNGYRVADENSWPNVTKDGNSAFDISDMNIEGDIDNGWNFYIGGWKSGDTAWYPASGILSNGVQSSIGSGSALWTNCSWGIEGRSNILFLSKTQIWVATKANGVRSRGNSIRCVAE